MGDSRKIIPKVTASGYMATSHLMNRLFNFLFALFFLIAVIPIIVILIPVMLMVNGCPILYAGKRLGKDKQVFIMYKLRTLPVNFERTYDAQLVSYKHGYRLPWFSRFMRDTRLDELPQLFNVLKGDMDFIGPRPVRPIVYDTYCKTIRSYDRRFTVNPGLIGYSQLFTPHSTPKRIRSFIDNRASKFKKSFLFDGFVIFLAGYAVLEKTFKMLYQFSVRLIMEKVLRRYTNKRGLDRIKQNQGQFFLCGTGDVGQMYEFEFKSPHGLLRDMNEEYLRVDTDCVFEGDHIILRGSSVVKTKVGQAERKSFFARGKVFKIYRNTRGPYKYTYILRYEPVSDLNRYFVDQYFLRKSLMRYVL